MLINIKMMTEEAYTTLQKNYNEVFELIKNNPLNNNWLENFLGFELYEIKKYTIEDFQLKDSDDYKNVAFENGIILYEHLKDLPRYIICNCRFWAWITFEKAYKQLQYSARMANASMLKNTLLGNNTRRFLMHSAIAKYYFRVECSIDETKENKYQLSKFLFDYPELYTCIVHRNFGMINSVNIALIQAIIDAQKRFQININNDNIQIIVKDTSRIGSVMLIDHMTQDEIYNILSKKIEKRFSYDLNQGI